MTALVCFSSLAADPAAAQRIAIDLPAAPLARSLALLGTQASASIGWPPDVSMVAAPAVRGRIRIADALARLLRGTPFRAVALGRNLWRVERAPPQARPHAVVRAATGPRTPASTQTDIVVTATKRAETIATVAGGLRVLGRADLATLGDAPDTNAVAGQITGLTATNLGPGRDRLFIRGIADSPFDGFGQSSVSVQLDEARLTYDAPDPDLRLIDMAQVEVLKGPQGPLYGTGALGGVYRMVPAKPDLDRPHGWLRTAMSATQDGGLAGTIDAMVDIPLVADTIGLRAVGYRIGQAGWIDTTGGKRDVNHGATSGGRIAVRARPASGWTIDVQGVTQSSAIADSQYVETRGAIARTARLPEPQDTDVTIASLTVSGPVGALLLTAAASATWQELDARYDASTKASLFGVSAPTTYLDHRDYQVRNYELRVAGSSGAIDWLAGGSLLSSRTNAIGTLNAAVAASTVLQFRREINEIAAFSEATLHLGSAWRTTGGVRIFRSAIDDRRGDAGTPATAGETVVRATPSLSLAWIPRPRLMLYARYATAFRPGGIEQTATDGQAANRYDADELGAVDLGLRWTGADGRLVVDAGVFASGWSHVQADRIGSTGLVSTRNAGDAHDRGGEATIEWQPDRRWSLTAGILIQRARLEEDAAAATGGDRRLPVVPDMSAHAQLTRTFRTGAWQHRADIRFSYVGESRLSFDPDLNRESGAISLLAASLASRHGRWTWRAGVDNIGNSRADSFAFGNPFTIAATPQHTPVRPRTVTLSLQRRW
ncbi:TonB-dependent receptor [Sphingomonas sp. CD22]|uniref:TonB-dependent receptor n=1 Tax=Sphingomonas sp. CD22 TaxID=3100214 RepID=UPI002AE07936|nr:TonB-dependent receptor [Sphingomonas sp. CD22]MEA1086346.1 TonB-dependent receptor [Sphingomonas sp. CD22]